MNPSKIEHEVSQAVIVGRFAVLFAAVVAFAAAILMSQRFDRDATTSKERYVCPMHPQVVSAAPGDCPICSMALERAQNSVAPPLVTTNGNVVDVVKRRVITQAIRAPAWVASDRVVSAVFHQDSLQGLAPGAQARFFRGKEPARAIRVRLSAEPSIPWDASTVRVSFVTDDMRQFRGETGWLQLDPLPRECLVVAESAVLYSSNGPYVLVTAAREHALMHRSIEVGKRLDSGYVGDQDADRLGEIVVLSGLREGERVAVADTFFLDAERRMRAARATSEEVVE